MCFKNVVIRFYHQVYQIRKIVCGMLKLLAQVHTVIGSLCWVSGHSDSYNITCLDLVVLSKSVCVCMYVCNMSQYMKHLLCAGQSGC